MTLLALTLAALLAYAGAWTPALALCLPLAFTLGRRTAIRSNGHQMIRTGTHRLVRGTW